MTPVLINIRGLHGSVPFQKRVFIKMPLYGAVKDFTINIITTTSCNIHNININNIKSMQVTDSARGANFEKTSPFRLGK